MKHKSHTRQDWLMGAWLILVSLCLLQGSWLDVRRDWAMGVLQDSISSLRGDVRASKALMWHIHGAKVAVDEDFQDIETLDGD